MRYILCLAYDRDTGECTYKLFQVERRALVPDQQQPEAVTVDSNTTVRLSSLLLLGLPLGCGLLDGIPESIDISLSDVLRSASCLR